MRALNGVLLASAVVPPIVVIILCRIAWVWAKTSEEERRISFGVVLRRAFWIGDRNESPT